MKGREMNYNTADTDGLLGVAFAALRYLEAREATAGAKAERDNPQSNEKYWAAHHKVLSAAARQSAAMRALKRCAKQLEEAK